METLWHKHFGSNGPNPSWKTWEVYFFPWWMFSQFHCMKTSIEIMKGHCHNFIKTYKTYPLLLFWIATLPPQLTLFQQRKGNKDFLLGRQSCIWRWCRSFKMSNSIWKRKFWHFYMLWLPWMLLQGLHILLIAFQLTTAKSTQHMSGTLLLYLFSKFDTIHIKFFMPFNHTIIY